MANQTMTRVDQAIEGRVAQILSVSELVINVGSENGVRRGMRFRVLAQSPLEICDPETGDVLDLLDREKTRVEAREVRPRITICRTYRTRAVAGGYLDRLGVGTSALQDAWKSPTEEPETLKAEDVSFPPPLRDEESYVKVKDRVVQILEAEIESKELDDPNPPTLGSGTPNGPNGNS